VEIVIGAAPPTPAAFAKTGLIPKATLQLPETGSYESLPSKSVPHFRIQMYVDYFINNLSQYGVNK